MGMGRGNSYARIHPSEAAHMESYAALCSLLLQLQLSIGLLQQHEADASNAVARRWRDAPITVLDLPRRQCRRSKWTTYRYAAHHRCSRWNNAWQKERNGIYLQSKKECCNQGPICPWSERGCAQNSKEKDGSHLSFESMLCLPRLARELLYVWHNSYDSRTIHTIKPFARVTKVKQTARCIVGRTSDINRRTWRGSVLNNRFYPLIRAYYLILQMKKEYSPVT
jgi:hypothetical protein